MSKKATKGLFLFCFNFPIVYNDCGKGINMKKVFKFLCAIICCLIAGLTLEACGNMSPVSNPGEITTPSNPTTPDNGSSGTETPIEPVEPEEPITPSEPTEPEEPITPSEPTEPVEPPEVELPVNPVEPEIPEESEVKVSLKSIIETIKNWLSQNGLINVENDELESIIENESAQLIIAFNQKAEDFEVLEILFAEEAPSYDEAYSVELNYNDERAIFSINKK